MKYIKLVCAALLFSTNGTGQLQLSAPQSGDSFIQGVGAYLSVGTNTGVANQVWDFSDTPMVQSVPSMVFAANETIYAKSFGSAETAIESGNSMVYYSFGDTFEYLGGVQDQLQLSYSDSEQYFPLPFYVEDTWEDTFACEYGAAGITIVRSGSVSSSCMAQGTLTLPGGQVLENAYQVSIGETILDTTPLGTYEVFIEGDYWLVESYPIAALANISLTTIDTPNGMEPIVQEQSYSVWMETYTVGVESNIWQPSWSMMPNPAQDELSVVRGDFQFPVQCVIFGLDGREVMREFLRPGIQVNQLDISQLTGGVYLVQVGESYASERLVIQR
jgi:hypothetical protein